MKKFESVIITKPDIQENEVEKIINKVKEIIHDGGNGEGNFEKVDDLGNKKLAYEIQRYKEGRYIVFYFQSRFELITELEKYYKQENRIMKFIVVKMED